jgi:hypothetical protein
VIETGERGHEAYACHLLGLNLGLEENGAQAAQSFSETLGLASELVCVRSSPTVTSDLGNSTGD